MVKKKEDEIPEWVTDEIQNAKFKKPEEIKKSGYILEFYYEDNKIDVQLYDAVEDGRHIVTMDVSKDIKIDDLLKGEVYEFVFDQPSKSITFDVFEKNRFVTTIIPLELLWGPYAVFLDDEKIYFHDYINNGTHVWLNMKPETSGEIAIIGTTAIPEFPMVTPLVIGFLMIFLVPFIQKFNLH